MRKISHPQILISPDAEGYIETIDPETGDKIPYAELVGGTFFVSSEPAPNLNDFLFTGEGEYSKNSGAPTYCYRFETDEQARAVLGYWYPSEENEPIQAIYRKADKRRKERIVEIKALAEELYVQDVTDDNGNTWKGGEASANKIKGGVELAEFAGLTEFTVTDAKRKEHVMTINEAKTVAALIGADYQRKFLARQAAVRTLESLDCFAADALQQIANVKLEV